MPIDAVVLTCAIFLVAFTFAVFVAVAVIASVVVAAIAIYIAAIATSHLLACKWLVPPCDCLLACLLACCSSVAVAIFATVDFILVGWLFG
jgi:hypothetical protein